MTTLEHAESIHNGQKKQALNQFVFGVCFYDYVHEPTTTWCTSYVVAKRLKNELGMLCFQKGVSSRIRLTIVKRKVKEVANFGIKICKESDCIYLAKKITGEA